MNNKSIIFLRESISVLLSTLSGKLLILFLPPENCPPSLEYSSQFNLKLFKVGYFPYSFIVKLKLMCR